jgi:uncharacterized protein YigE (DUF2233 family)
MHVTSIRPRSLPFLLLIAVASCKPPVKVEQVAANGKSYTVVQASPKSFRIGMAWKRADGTRYRTLAAFRKEHPNAVFATNGGIFSKDYAPLGLYVEDQKQLVPINLDEGKGNFFLKPNGVVTVDTSGNMAVVEATAYKPTGIAFAVQSGPLLLKDGKENPSFDPSSQNRRIRSGVGVKGDGTVVFVLSKDQVTFHDLAMLFRDHLGCPNALFLDGDLSEMSPPDSGDKNDLTSIIWLEPR